MGEFKWNRPEKMSYPGGTTKEFDYDAFMKLKNISSLDPGANRVQDLNYIYDKADNITDIDSTDGDKSYNYDNLYRLTNKDFEEIPAEEFTYDNSGNRTSSSDIPEWSYNENNELISYKDTELTYDENGNLATKTENGVKITYTYTPRGRIDKIWKGEPDSGTLIAEYSYDPFGRRLSKETDKGKTYFIYSDEGLAGETDSSGNIKRTYLFKPGSQWGTDPVILTQNNKVYFYHNDHLGTPKNITSKSGKVVWKAKYSSFGKADIVISDIENNLRFPGQYFDEETGYHYNWHRYYDPGVGRYLRVDPIGFGGGVNLYGYVLNDPINNIDPLGLINWGAVGKGTIATFGGAVGVVTGAAASTTGVGAIGGVPAVLGGSAAFGWGVSQIIAGFMDNEIPFMGVKEAVIKNTTDPGLLQDELLGVNTLNDMLLTGRTKPTDIGKINSAIQGGQSIYNSGSTIIDSIYKNDTAPSSPCK